MDLLFFIMAAAIAAVILRFVLQVRHLRDQDDQRAADVRGEGPIDQTSPRSAPLGLEGVDRTAFDRVVNSPSFRQAEEQANRLIPTFPDLKRPHLEPPSPPRAHRMSRADSATALVRAIADRHPLVLFMAGPTATEADQLAIDLFTALGPPLYLVDTSADPDMSLALPSPSRPLLYLGGEPFGDARKILDASRNGHLRDTMSKAGMSFDAAVAAALIAR